jgi:hypothetical protein
MLERLLNLIRSGGSWTTQTLAKRLDTSSELVEAMMEHLKRQGLVHDFEAPCTESCRQCAFGDTCQAAAGSHPHLWRV